MASDRSPEHAYACALGDVEEFPSSARIELRVPDQRDVDLVVDASTDALISLITTVPPNCTPSQAREFVGRQRRRPTEGHGWSLTIVDRASGVGVGNLFVSCRSLELGGLELGYWVGPSHRGRGFAAEALRTVRDWAFREFDANRQTLYIDPQNAASLRTARRAGFRLETAYDRWEKIGDEFRPMTVWSRGPGRPEPTHIGRLEHRMWTNAYRGDLRWLDHHLHPDFVEQGCSGARSTRRATLDTPVDDATLVRLPLSAQRVQQLARGTWMLTYLAHQPDRSCRRVSIWQELADGWRLRFHQATPIA